MSSKGKIMSLSTITTKTITTNITILTTLIFTPALFFALISSLDISFDEFDKIIKASEQMVPDLIKGLNNNAKDALTFIWLIINQEYNGYNFYNLSKILKNPYKYSKYTPQLLKQQKILLDHIKKIKTLNINTITSNKTAAIFKNLWEKVSQFLSFYTTAPYYLTQSKYQVKTQKSSKSFKNYLNDFSIMSQSKHFDTEEHFDTNNKFISPETEYYNEVYKPYMEERNADFNYLNDDDEYSYGNQWDIYENQLKNAGYLY